MNKAVESWKSKLKQIDTFIFDIDGVITDGKVYTLPDNQLARTIYTKDGLALKYAAAKGYRIAVISGGNAEGIRDRLQYLNIKDVFLKSDDKLPVLLQYMKENNLSPEQIAYMGDDIFDIPVLDYVGLSAAPANAAREVLERVDFVTPQNGGEGCVRELIEQVLRVRGDWFDL